jgi:lysophospholipase L1-like esterase
VIFGDSIAHAVGDSPQFVNEGRPGERLSIQLTEPGQPAGEIRFLEAMYHRNPSAVVIIGGTNDVLEGLFIGGAHWLDWSESALRRMVRIARARSVPVYLTTVVPQRANGRRDRGRYNAPIEALNDRIGNVAVEERAHLIDLHALVSSNIDRFLSADDVHLSNDGLIAVRSLVLDCVLSRPVSVSAPTGARLCW